MLFDSEGKVLSFPPIINSNDLGKITEESRNLLVEVTGTLHKTVLNTLNLVTLALIDRGGKAYSATIHYPTGTQYTEGTVITPNFSNRRIELNLEETNKLLGLKLSASEIADLLGTAGLDVEKVTDNALNSAGSMLPSRRHASSRHNRRRRHRIRIQQHQAALA